MPGRITSGQIISGRMVSGRMVSWQIVSERTVSRMAKQLVAVALMLLATSGCVTAPAPAPAPAPTPTTLTAVVFAESAESAAHAAEAVRARITHKLPLIDAVGATISEEQLTALSETETVSRIVVSTNENGLVAHSAPDEGVTSWLTSSQARNSSNPLLLQYMSDAAPSRTGKGVGVAIIDTGLSGSPQFASEIPALVGSYNALTGEQGPIDDRTGHGTHLASLLSGFGETFSGIAPQAKIVAIKAFDSEDRASALDIIDAVQWVLNNRARYNIRILNLSVSASTELPYHIDPLNMALTQAWIQGLVVVVSAGNEGPQPSSVTAPGNNPWLITVGAADYSTDGQWRSVAPFSGRGPTDSGHIKPDIVAPGTLLAGLRPAHAIRPEGEPDHFDAQGNWIASGSSQASAVVSGMIAVLLEARPELSNHDVKCLLANTALPLQGSPDATSSPFSQGRGFINLKAALTSTDVSCEESLEGSDPAVPVKGAYKPS